jgi:hypothetical protein
MANVQFHTLDPLGQSAIELGLEQISALSPIEELTLELDELTKQKLKRLSSSMSLSIRTLIESAINYTYAYAIETHKTSAELQTLMPAPGTFLVQISLSLETTSKLERLDMTPFVSGFAIIGINLLYDRLIAPEIPIHD